MKDALDKIIIRKCCNDIQNKKMRQKSFPKTSSNVERNAAATRCTMLSLHLW